MGKNIYVFILVSGFFLLSKNLQSANMHRISEFSNINQAIEICKGKILIIDKLIEVENTLKIPDNVYLYILPEGGFIKKKENSLLYISGNLTAPMNKIFYNFSPGDVKLNSYYIKECYPIWWGADLTGKIDSSDAIQSAIDSGCSRVFLTSGTYLLEKPLNMTHKIGFTFEGVNHSLGSPSATILIGNTGGIVIDASGSRYLQLKNFAIEKGSSRPSTVGIYFARTDKIQFSEFNYIEKVRIRLHSDIEANNGKGTIGIYNHAAELWRATDIYVMADNCVVFTGYNIFNIYSPYVNTKLQYPSMSEAIIDGISTLHSFKGACVIIDNGIAIKILNAYYAGSGVSEKSYAIRIEGTGFWGSTLEFTGHLERGGGILFTKANLTNMRIDISTANCGPLIHIQNGSINDSEIRITHYERVSRKREFFTEDSFGSVSNTTFYVEFPDDKFNGPNLKLNNCIFKGAISFDKIKENIFVKEGSSFIIVGKDKMEFIIKK